MNVALPSPEGWSAAHRLAAVVDRSACGRLALAGRDRVVHLHRLCTNEVRHLQPGQGLSAVLTTEKGRIKDLVTVLCRADDLLLLTSAGMGAEVKAWLDRFVIREKVAVADLSGSLGQLLCLGPRAMDVVRQATGLDPAPLPRWHTAAGDGVVVLQGEPYLGHAGVHLIVPAERQPDTLQLLQRAGAAAIDAATFDALRIASGVPACPAELDDQRNPWEARLDGSIDLDKGCYIGQEVIARLDTYKKVSRALVRLEIEGELGAPDAAKLPLSRDGRDVGYATSLARHPDTGHLIGLGYLAGEQAEPAVEVTVGGAAARVHPVAPWARAGGA